MVFDQHADETLQAADDGPVQHHRVRAAACFRHVFATQAFSGKTRDEPPKSSNKEVDALRAELEALQAKVDKLSR